MRHRCGVLTTRPHLLLPLFVEMNGNPTLRAVAEEKHRRFKEGPAEAAAYLSDKTWSGISSGAGPPTSALLTMCQLLQGQI